MEGKGTEELKGTTRVNGKSRIAKNIKEANSSMDVFRKITSGEH